jgi:hypothetical protein
VDQEVCSRGEGSDGAAIRGVSHDDDLPQDEGAVQHLLSQDHCPIGEGEALSLTEATELVEDSLLDSIALLQRLAVPLDDLSERIHSDVPVFDGRVLHHIPHTGDGVADRHSAHLKEIMVRRGLVDESIAVAEVSGARAGRSNLPSGWGKRLVEPGLSEESPFREQGTGSMNEPGLKSCGLSFSVRSSWIR